MQGPRNTGGQRPPKKVVYLEDALILLAIVALFVLTVFFRHEVWGQAALVLVGLVMLVIFVRRLRRVHRAFTGHDEQD